MPFDLARSLPPVGAKLGGRPCPLLRTGMSVWIKGGAAAVCVSRTFRNAGDRPMEATLTFPVPPRASVHDLVVRVGERVLRGAVQARGKARAAYEEGMERGKAAFLHEQVAAGCTC